MLGRAQVVPFRASFLGREDPNVEPEMRKETAGILHKWMLAAREFLKIGLRPPQCVVDASKELFAEGDVVGRFIRERLDFKPSEFTLSEDLRGAYSQYLTDVGQPDTLAEMNALQRRLKTYPGVASVPKRIKERVCRVWTGIAVKEDVTDVTL
jgi:phage/plasmid-associated DNA primase